MKRWIVPVTSASVIIGALLAMQYKSQLDERRLTPSRRVEDLVFLLKSTEKANEQLSEQVAGLREKLRDELPKTEPEVIERRQGSYPAMGGPGLVVKLSEGGTPSQLEEESSAVVHAEDLLKIINELRTGGAEAVALNGHRLTELSEIVTAGQHILVNRAPIRPPYEIAAVGPAKEMKDVLGLRGGVIEYLQFYGIEVKTEVRTSLAVPAAKGLAHYKFAKPPA